MLALRMTAVFCSTLLLPLARVDLGPMQYLDRALCETKVTSFMSRKSLLWIYTYMFKYVYVSIYIHIHVFRPTQDSSVRLG